jgi:undecaprenyl-diphosphatase
MATGKTALFARRIWKIDTSICRGLNRTSRIYGVRPFFTAVSRLGDGVFWYTLIALIALLDTEAGYLHALQMLATGAVGLLIYKLIKLATVRPRPYAGDNGIDLCAQPLDQYSFPSGHTLHAVSFSIIACAHYPMLYEPLFLFATLVALSRMVLGLHYPTDVVAGAAIGATLAGISLSLYS